MTAALQDTTLASDCRKAAARPTEGHRRRLIGLCEAFHIIILAVLAVGWAGTAEAQGIIVDHRSLPLFDQIPAAYLEAARAKRLMWVDQSVGYNQHQGLDCLTYYPVSAAPSSCRRNAEPPYDYPASEITWGQAYPRPNWFYYGWPGFGTPLELPCTSTNGLWTGYFRCFAEWLDAHPTQYDVVAWQWSYLQVDPASSIETFFGSGSPNITDFEALQARHPNTPILWSTTSLSRSTGSAVSTAFNNRVRAYVQTHGGYLLDVADIESRDPSGNPCYDNRDGVAYYFNGTLRENYPDDGINQPAICQHYTSESEGGHLGNPSAGQIRLAKAWWILMARVAGWNPGGGGEPPPPPPPSGPAAPSNLRILR